MERMTERDDRSLAAIIDQAASWYVANREGLTPAQRSAFAVWLQTSPVHVREYLCMADAAGELAEQSVSDPELAGLISQARQAKEDANVVSLSERRMAVADSPALRSRWPALAASVVLLAAVLGVLGWQLNLFTPAAQRYQIAGLGHGVWRLGDGSVLHLDANSMVDVRFTDTERQVRLLQGRALFEVAHASVTTPGSFRVTTPTSEVVAVGTRFEVNHQSGRDAITVVDGGVTVQATGRSEVAKVVAGQGVKVVQGEISSPTTVSAGEVYAWVQHPVAFESQPLAGVVSEINRYALHPITVTDQTLTSLPVSGVFNTYDAESFVAFLARLPEVTVERVGGRVLVSRAAG